MRTSMTSTMLACALVAMEGSSVSTCEARDPEPTQEETPYSIARAKLRWGNNKAHSSKTKRNSKAKIAKASKKRNR